MAPKYSGQMLDKLILIAAQQTAAVRENPDDKGYVAKRSTVLETVAWAMWETRNRLQDRRRANTKKKGP